MRMIMIAAVMAAAAAPIVAVRAQTTVQFTFNDESRTSFLLPRDINVGVGEETSFTVGAYSRFFCTFCEWVYVDLTFYTGEARGGLRIQEFNAPVVLFDATGPQLFTGPLYFPHFNPGIFQLFEVDGDRVYQLTIRAVPEPASWTLMICGFGLVGAASRRRHRLPSILPTAVRYTEV